MPVLQLTMKGRLDGPGVEWRNVFYMEDPLAGPAEAEAAIAAIVAAYDTHLKSQMHNDWRLYGATWRNVSVAGYGGVDVEFADVVGTNTLSEMLPPQVAGLVSFKTGTQRPNKGRKYLTGFGENAQAAGRFIPTVVSAMQAWGNAIIAYGGGGGFPGRLGVAQIDPATGLAVAFNNYSVAIAREIVATQRSRRIGQGI